MPMRPIVRGDAAKIGHPFFLLVDPWPFSFTGLRIQMPFVPSLPETFVDQVEPLTHTQTAEIDCIDIDCCIDT